MLRAYDSYIRFRKYKYRLNINHMKNSESAYITSFSNQPESDGSGKIRAPRPPEPVDLGTLEKTSSYNPPGPSVSSPLHKVDLSSITMEKSSPFRTPKHNESSRIETVTILTAQAKQRSSSSAELGDSVTNDIMSSSITSEPGDYGPEVNIGSISPSNTNDSATEEKNSSSSQAEPDNSGTVVKISSSSPPKPDDSGTVEISSCSPPEPDDSGTVVKMSSCSLPEPDNCRTLVNAFENYIHSITLQHVSFLKEENRYRETLKQKDELLLMNEKRLAENKKLLNRLRQGGDFKEEIIPLQQKGIMYKERFFECKKMGNNSKKAIKVMFMNLSVLFKQLKYQSYQEINRLIGINKYTDDGSSIIPDAVHTLLASDDILCHFLGFNLINEFFCDKFGETSDPHYPVIIEGILDKSTQARKCANWFLHKACNLEILCDDIHYSWIYNSLKLTYYANLIDSCLGLNIGGIKENMYEQYISLLKGDFEKKYLRTLHQGEIDLDESDIKYKLLEARKPRFERSKLCISEHNAPFCELCGWPGTWLKTFKKRGIYIKEAPDWTMKYIWYNEINDESN